MKIIKRGEKEIGTRPFKPVCGDFIIIPVMSHQALGVYVRLLYLPPNWNFTVKGFVKQFPCSKEGSTRKYLKELQKHKLIEMRPERNERGEFIEGSLVINCIPGLADIVNNSNMENPNMGNLNMGNPYMGNPKMGTPEMGNPDMENPETES